MTVKIIEVEETYDIRKEVLRKGIDLPYQFSGDKDEESFHLGAYVANKLVGVASFMKSRNDSFNEHQYQLRGMATLGEYRGFGVGKMLIERALEVLQNKRIVTLWCNAREVAVNFYTKQGFKIQGNKFLIEKVGPHYTMYSNVN